MYEQIVSSINGGTGGFPVNRAFRTILDDPKKYGLTQLDFYAFITIYDRGGSSGKLLRQYGGIPVGDFRQAVAALTSLGDWVMGYLNYRDIDERGDLGQHPPGNMILQSLWNYLQTLGLSAEQVYELYFERVKDFFRTKGATLPIAIPNGGNLIATVNGKTIVGEDKIDVLEKNGEVISDVRLEPPPEMYPRARDVLASSDIVIISPGSLYTSIAPNLLVSGMREACRNARVYWVANLVIPDKHHSGDVIDGTQTVLRLNEWLGRPLNGVLIHDGMMNHEVREAYTRKRMYQAVYDEGLLGRYGIKDVRYADVAWETEDEEGPLFRHSHQKLVNPLCNIVKLH